MAASRFGNQQYKNWLRGTLAFQYWKEGIEFFVDDQAASFHAKLLRDIDQSLPACSGMCTAGDIKKHGRQGQWLMSCATCNAWLEESIKYHIDSQRPQLSPENTDPQLWPIKPWEVMKIYMSFGCKSTEQAKDADAQAILSLFRNCKHFGKKIRKQNLVQELLNVRNALCHSGYLSVEDSKLTQYLETLLEFLQQMTDLTDRQDEQRKEAVRNIKQLQDNKIDMSLNQELELRLLFNHQKEMEKDLKTRTDILEKDKCIQASELNSQKQLIGEIQTSLDRFHDFLKHNNLVHDLTRFSTSLDEHQQMLETHGTSLMEHDARLCTIEKMTFKGEAQVACSVQSWEDRCKDLRTVLMKHYQATCLVVPNPAEISDVGLEYVYVDTAIKVLRESKGRDGLKIIKDDAASFSYRKLFYTDEYQCRQIYITGEAGSGKSMMCKNIVRLWCEAHGLSLPNEPEDCETSSDEEESRQTRKQRQWEMKARREESREILSHFTLLFYITLRDSLSEYAVSEMIESQILKYHASVKYISASDVLSNERCLIIVDGLDEWVCPTGAPVSHFMNSGIPGRDIFNKNVVLMTTSRPWKLDMLQLRDSEVDKHVELCKLSKKSASQICSKVIRLLNKSHSCRKQKQQFFQALVQKGLGHLKTIPVLLIQLICLWFDNQELGKSQVQLYCAMLDLLLKKSQKNLCVQTTNTPTCVPSETPLPTNTPTSVASETPLPTNTPTRVPSETPLPTNTPTSVPSETPLPTNTPTSVASETPLPTNTPKRVASETPLPECILINPHCLIHQQLIYSLSRVAYEALFDKTKENSLVFKSSQLEIYGVGQESIDMCLKSGILSQNKVLEKCSVSEKKMSFLHKKFQEFLATIFVASCDDVHDVIKHITDFCSTLDTCLEMSQVWLFMSGIRPDITRQLLEHLTRVVSADTKVKHYRQTIPTDVCSPAPHFIRDIQTCVADCVIEWDNNGHSYDGFMLEDFYIDSNTACHVERLSSCIPRSKVKSVYIDTKYVGESQLTRITGQLKDCKSVQKLSVYDPFLSGIDISTVTKIVNNNLDTLTCLNLNSFITGTGELVSDICSISSKCLMALRLWYVRLTHEHIEQILTRLPHSPTIRQLVLHLHCTDHGTQCRARIDLSTMTHIHTLELCGMSVDNLQSVSDSVEYVRLVFVILPVTTLCEFARRLVRTGRHVKVELDLVTVSEVKESRVDVETFLRTCHGLEVRHCQYIDSKNRWSIHYTTSSQ